MGGGLGPVDIFKSADLVLASFFVPHNFQSLRTFLLSNLDFLPHDWDDLGFKTYTWEFGAAVTALGSSSSLLEVQVSQLAAWSLDDADLVALGVVGHPPALFEFCQSISPPSSIVFAVSVGRT